MTTRCLPSKQESETRAHCASGREGVAGTERLRGMSRQRTEEVVAGSGGGPFEENGQNVGGRNVAALPLHCCTLRSSPCSPFSWRCSGKPPSGKRPRV